MTAEDQSNTPKNRLSLSIDYRVISLVLLAVIAGMTLVWKPWQTTSSANAKTIVVTGEAKETATPDEFIFMPSYQFARADKQEALNELSKKSDELVAKLKSLGVPENKIKTDTNNYGQPYSPDKGTPDYTYLLTLTVEVNTKELAQKVQDYLISTAPSGSITPIPSFSNSKRKELEHKARDEASKDARTKADQTAKNLGTKVTGVKSVTEGSGFGGPVPLEAKAVGTMDSSIPTLGLHPGENELTYTITVTFIIR